MTRLPIRWRLTLAFTAVMAVLLAATGLFVQQRLASNLDHALQRSLAARAADVAALAQQSESGLKEAKGGARTSRADLAQLIDGRGRVIDRSATAPSRPLLPASLLATVRAGGPVTRDLRAGPARRPLRVRAQPVRAQGQTLVIAVGQSLEERDRALSDLVGVLMVGGPAALILASLAGFLLTGAALRPVEAMRRRAAAISATDLRQRLPSPRSHDELERLGNTLNEMLSRIQIAVARERTFVSDASHELRSPLAMLRTELELIGRDRPSGVALQQAVGSAVEETDRLSRLADDLLLLARADEGALVLTPEVIAVDVLLTGAAERGRTRADVPTITVAASHGLSVLGEPGQVGQALDNLVANAARHAAGHVGLSAQAAGGLVELHVTDDGAGFPAAFLPEAWKRFARADAGRTVDGAGVGLAIVRAIAERHGGHSGAANRSDGGADVWVAIPAPSTPR